MVHPAYENALRAIAQPIRAAEMPRSLAPMRRLLDELGSPQKNFPSVVVTGSVGKGTTSHKIARVIQTASSLQKIGLFTGPHLHSFRERFRINNEMISQEAFVEPMNAVQQAASHLEFSYSTFEMATALILWWFAQQKVDIAILEVGIGGRWDAVNTVENVLAVFTPIEPEHVTMLGGSLQTIAWNKAGIIQPGGWAVSPHQSPIVEDILKLEAEQKSAKLILSRDASFVGKACYLLAEHRFIPPLPDLTGIVHRPEHLPGRLEAHQINGRKLVIDGGHTPSSAQYLRDFLDDQYHVSDSPIHLIVGMLKDKSAHDFLAVFDSPRFHITLTTAPGHRALAPDILAVQANLQSAAVEIVPDLKDALAQIYAAPESRFVIAGSLRMAAAAREFYGLLSPEELAEARTTRAIFESEDYLSKLG
ncbi:MAG: Mur ligase family protein [Chloroflexota bacterium]